MSTYTSRFNLFKYDTTADAKSAFSITQALNNNWDALDLSAVKRGTTAAIGNSSTPVYVDATGTIQPCSYSIPTSSGLTATTSLAENGYIKFSSFGSYNQDKSRKPWKMSRITDEISRLLSYFLKFWSYKIHQRIIHNLSFEKSFERMYAC